jgi:hypothetical protein
MLHRNASSAAQTARLLTRRPGIGEGSTVAYVLVAATVVGLSLIPTPLVRALVLRVHVVDEPGVRRIHARPVPRLGGLAVLVAGVALLPRGLPRRTPDGSLKALARDSVPRP